jgi:enoyl-CoA hydratase
MAGEAVNKPVMIAMQGISFTCAVELMLNADIRIAADNCRFAQLEVLRGFHACGGATLRLPMEIGWGNAQRYLLTGDEWSAQQSLQWGRAC